MKINQAILAALVLGVFAATPWHAIAGYVFDDFETYSSGAKVNTFGNGWGSEDNTALVTNLLAASGSQSLYLPPQMTVTNSVATNVPHIWTEFRLYDSGRVIPGSERPPRGTESVMMGISTGGYALVYDPGVVGWTTYTNDVWGTNMVVATNAWATFAVFQDYANHTNAVFLNGHLMRAGLPFISNSLGSYRAFKCDGGNLTNSFLDAVIITNAIPASLTNMDLDNDGVLDATEIETTGNVTTCRRLTNWVSATGAGSINPTGTFTVTWNTNLAYSMAAVEAYVVGAVTNNGVDVGPFTGKGTRSATYTNLNITSDHTITVSFIHTGIRYVPGDYGTITGALAVAQAGDQIVVSNAAYDGSITLSNGVALVGTNMGVNATNLTLNGALTVVTGSVNVVSGAFTVTGQVSVAAGGLLTISNAAASFGGLTFADAGGRVRVVGGALTVNGIRMEGTFTLDTNWQTTFVKSTLNFTDGFENYATNIALNALGHFGWAATGAGAVVQDLVKTQGVHAALIPASVAVSNTVSAATGLNLWTELYLNETAQVAPFPPSRVNSNSAVMVFVGTNGYLTVYNPALANWDVCSNDVMNQSVAQVGTGQWSKITIFQNFSDHKAAIFLNSRLLREQLGFISNSLSQYGSLHVESGPRGMAHVDSVSIWTNMSAGLTNGPMSDLDHDGIADAVEILQYGTTTLWPRGSVFKIR